MFFYLHLEDQNGYKVTKRDFLSKFLFTKFLVEKVKSGTKLPKNGLFGIFFKKIWVYQSENWDGVLTSCAKLMSAKILILKL